MAGPVMPGGIKKGTRLKPGLGPLTERETAILSLFAQGLVGKEVADEMGISFLTVETHRHHIVAKLRELHPWIDSTRRAGLWYLALTGSITDAGIRAIPGLREIAKISQ